MDADDLFAIRRVLTLYGNHIDDRRWGDLTEVFLPDARFDTTAFGAVPTTSLDDLVARWTASGFHHCASHHTTDVLVDEDADGTVRAVTKGLAVEADGRVWAMVYRDVLVRTAEGWRIAWRTVEPSGTSRRFPDLQG